MGRMARHTRNDPERDELWKEFHRLVTMPSPELSDWLVETREGVEIYANEPDVDIRELGEGVSRILGKRSRASQCSVGGGPSTPRRSCPGSRR